MKHKTAKIGKRGYARALRHLIDHPSAVPQARDALGIGHGAAWRIIPGLHQLGQAHIVGWLQKPRQRAIPIYKGGPGVDVPPPTHQVRNGRPVNGTPAATRLRKLPVELVSFCCLLRALATPINANDLAAETGAAIGHMRYLLDYMRQIKLVRIASWMRADHGLGVPVKHFQFAPNKPDMPRPAKRSPTERALHWNRLRRTRNAQLKTLHALAANASIFNQPRQA